MTVRVTLTAACPFFPQIELEARYIVENEPEQNNEPTWFPLEASEPGKFQTVLPPPPTGSERAVMVRIRALRRGKPVMTITKEPIPLPELPMDWVALARTVALQLLLVNMVLGVLGGSGYGIYRYYTRYKSTPHA